MDEESRPAFEVPARFGPGSRIAGYVIEEQIGQGGMAVVFRAHDERLDRTVALKILAPALAADDAFRQRFIRESRAAAAVDDPHIIPVFEAGEASDVLFIAMRFVPGGDVRSLIQGGGLPPVERVAAIVTQVASALDAAHARGLVHRDVKPGNMLLDARTAADDRPDHVYLSDFGLSKLALQTTGLTERGTFLGTLDYVAPEQIDGRAVDGRADQYSLGCTAFVYVWDVASITTTSSFALPGGPCSTPCAAVSALAFSGDGSLLAAANESGSAELWSVEQSTGSPIQVPATATGRAVWGISFSGSGLLAMADDDGQSFLYQVAGSRLTSSLAGVLADPSFGQQGVGALAFSPNGRYLVTGDTNGRAYLWRVG